MCFRGQRLPEFDWCWLLLSKPPRDMSSATAAHPREKACGKWVECSRGLWARETLRAHVNFCMACLPWHNPKTSNTAHPHARHTPHVKRLHPNVAKTFRFVQRTSSVLASKAHEPKTNIKRQTTSRLTTPWTTSCLLV